MPRSLDERTSADKGRGLAARSLSFRDFVDDALHHPAYGYYGAGRVQFGDGGHYDTYPLALSPIFGRMLAEYAHRLWRRSGRPDAFEICELGAGNGQLCADTLIWIAERSRHEAGWRRFADRCRYRIVERSPALVGRQRQVLGTLSDRVVWTCTDLAREHWRRPALGAWGLVFANEVLDALSHHKVVAASDGHPSVAFVVPRLRKGATGARGRIIARARLARELAAGEAGSRLAFDEVLLPLSAVPGLERFLRRYYAEIFTPPTAAAPYFACADIERLLRNTARLYSCAEICWIDYGADRAFHRSTPENLRVFAGPPRSGHSVYDRPGDDDITFMVDFSTLAAAAQRVGLAVAFYGSQAELARRSGVALDRRAVNLIVRARAVGWVLAVVGVGPEQAWRRGALGWGAGRTTLESVRTYVERSVAEFTGRLETTFKLMILQKTARRRPPTKVPAGRRRLRGGHARRTRAEGRAVRPRRSAEP
jgi:SAM-dependent MidA family methyltransferase